MEFVECAKELKKEIDLLYYFENDIIGLYTRYELDKITQFKDKDEKYKWIDKYFKKMARKTYKWIEWYYIWKKNYEYAYKRSYGEASKIGRSYEIFHGNHINFEDFKVSEPIKRL